MIINYPDLHQADLSWPEFIVNFEINALAGACNLATRKHEMAPPLLLIKNADNYYRVNIKKYLKWLKY